MERFVPPQRLVTSSPNHRRRVSSRQRRLEFMARPRPLKQLLQPVLLPAMRLAVQMALLLALLLTVRIGAAVSSTPSPPPGSPLVSPDQPALGPTWTPRVTLTRSPHPQRQIDWSSENIYLILIDRFQNGDPDNDSGGNPASHIPFSAAAGNHEALKSYQGGDLQGVIDKLGYLQQLGVTTIWLSPVFDNSDSDFVGWWPYHGYHPIDFFSVDEHFGDLALLKRLVDLAHRRGMKVLLDMIFNHVAPDHPWITDPQLRDQAGYRHWFHPHSGIDGSTSIQDWQDQQQLEQRELNGLPDLAQENPHVYDFLLDVAKFWIVESGCDGFRLDAVKHIPISFWEKICRDLHAFAGPDFLLLGEVFAGETPYVAGYQSAGFNALFDIPLYYTINRVFAQGGSMPLLTRQSALNCSAYQGLLLSPVLDNHDVARFSYWAGRDPGAKMAVALTYLLTQHGLPMLYYGNEVALEGAAATNEQSGAGQDYLNRLPMPWERVTGADRDLVQHTRRLLQLRRRLPALRSSGMTEIYQDYGIYAYLKHAGDQAVLVVLSNSARPERRSIPLPPGLFAPGCRFDDQLFALRLSARRDTLHLDLAPRASHLFLVKGRWQPQTVTQLPWNIPFTARISGDMRWIDFYWQGEAQSVSVAGDFNGWRAGQDTLARMGITTPPEEPASRASQGSEASEPSQASQVIGAEAGAPPPGAAPALWHGRLPLKQGRYRYKLVIDGSRWIADPAAADFELDPYGSQNSILIVP